MSTHHNGVIMGAMAYQITSLTIIYSIVFSGADQRKHQSSASLAFVRGIHQWPVNSSQRGPVTRKMFPFDDAIILRVSVGLLSFDLSPKCISDGGYPIWCNPQHINILGRNKYSFTRDIFKFIFLSKADVFSIKFQWNLFLCFLSTICQQRFR